MVYHQQAVQKQSIHQMAVEPLAWHTYEPSTRAQFNMQPYLILEITYPFAATVLLGPFQTYLNSQILINGWRRTIPAAFAPLLRNGPIIALGLLILGRIPVWLWQVLQSAGGAFLLYLAVSAVKAWRDLNVKKTVQS